MNPVRGIETTLTAVKYGGVQSFKLMNPVRGIETPKLILGKKIHVSFQINESRSRDWNIVD